MSPNAPTRFAILAAIDDSDASPEVVASAARLAAAFGTELHVVHVFDAVDYGGGAPPALSFDARLEQSRRLVSNASDDARGSFTGAIHGHVVGGTPVQTIVELAASMQADLIVVGTHGRRGIARAVLGSVAENVVRRASCPVLVVRPKGDAPRASATTIEPPCPDCLEAQKTAGAGAWCARHSQHHPKPHLHYAYPQPFAQGSMLVRS